MEVAILLITFCVIIILFIYWSTVDMQTLRKESKIQFEELKNRPVEFDYKKIDQLPQKILESLQGSANSTSGKLGELVSFIQLKAQYDRLIALGDIADILAIKFPTETNPGAIHFLEVKTGKRAALSADQRKLRNAINNHPEIVKFMVVKNEISHDTIE